VKPGALLLVGVQREAQTRRIDPLLAHLGQPPYGPIFGQGVCDLRQARSVGDVGKAVALLCEREMGPSGLTSHVLVAVENDLRPNGGWPAILIVMWPQSGSSIGNE